MPHSWTLDDVARLRLISHGLLEPVGDAADAVRHLTCSQAQDYPGSTLSIALRTKARTLAGVRDAYDSGTIVRSWPMRGTLFAVAAEDLGWMLSLTADKVHSQSARRRESLGLTDAKLATAEKVAVDALAGGGLTRAEIMERWTDAGHEVDAGRGYHTLFHLALQGIICLGPTAGKEQRFVLSSEWIPKTRSLGPAEAVAEWWRRYALSHGPVSVKEFRWWTKLLAREATPAAEAVADHLESIEVDGVRHWHAPGLLDRDADLRARASEPLLLPGFDELVLGYGDRRAILTKAQEAEIVPGGNGVFRPTVVIDGHAVGLWKRRGKKDALVSVEPFEGETLPRGLTGRLPALTKALPAD